MRCLAIILFNFIFIYKIKYMRSYYKLITNPTKK